MIQGVMACVLQIYLGNTSYTEAIIFFVLKHLQITILQFYSRKMINWWYSFQSWRMSIFDAIYRLPGCCDTLLQLIVPAVMNGQL